MVSRGFVAPERTVPSPDMSFVRLFNDNSIGWQQRGQYAMWTGASPAGAAPFRLLERVGNRVAPIAHNDGGPVLHKIAAGVAFTIENAMGCWLAFDSDALWLDTPSTDGRCAFLAIGGTAGKPGTTVIDWTCPCCGSSIHRHDLTIAPLAFTSMLKRVEALVKAFNADESRRTCSNCHSVHPVVETPEVHAEKPSA